MSKTGEKHRRIAEAFEYDRQIDDKRDIQRDILVRYLRMKVDQGDWHAVSDAANDLRVMEAKQAK